MTRPTALLAAIALSLAAASAAAGEAVGPPFGANRYAASVRRVCSEADADDYAASLVAGERLSVTVSAAKGSALRPRLVLVDPQGSEVLPSRVSVRSGGKSVALKGWTVPSTGRWGVRVAGEGDTEGAYTVAFSVARAPTVKAKALVFTSQTLEVPFEGIDGASLDLRLSWTPPTAVLSLDAIMDPAGRPLADFEKTVRGASIAVKAPSIRSGDGTYSLRLRRGGGNPVVDVRLTVVPQGRPTGKKAVALEDDEPWLEDAAQPIRGVPGVRVRFAGGNFRLGAAPTVLFDRHPAVVSVVTTSALDVYPPDVAEGTLVDVTVLDASGQSCTKQAYFEYAASPKVTDLLDANLAPLRFGPGAGGNTGLVRGTGFALGQKVRFGAAEATVVALSGSIQAEVVIPPGTGDVPLSVVDSWGRSSTSSFRYSYKSPPRLAASPYAPPYGAVAGGTVVTVTGTGFEPADRLSFDGAPIAVTYVNATTLRFTTPARAPGSYALAIFDRYAGRTDGPQFTVKPPPSIGSATAIGGLRIDGSRIAAGGGAVVEVTGEFLSLSDSVTLGGASGEATSCDGETLLFTTSAAPVGLADLVVTDAVGQSATLEDAFELVGWSDATSSHSPGASDTDDLSAQRGALADFDGDGDDDLLLTTTSAIGTRAELTRLFLNGDAGFEDVSGANLPSAYSDPAASDDFAASALTIGDLDGDDAVDFVLGGASVPSGGSGDFEVRAFLNDGDGRFQFDVDSPRVRTESWMCTDTSSYYYGMQWELFAPDTPAGDVTCLAIGDLDGDGDADMAVGTDRFRTGSLSISLQYVTFQGDEAYVSYWPWYSWSRQVDSPALRVFENRRDLGEGFVDRTFTRLPRSEQNTGTLPAFHARDMKAADLDGDGDLDLVVAWDDPTTVTPAGLVNGTDSPRVATRVLLNDGNGFFEDATASWMPAASGDEYWQASRILLLPLDGDDDPDLVLVHDTSIDAFRGAPTYTASALRILRNDGDGAGFVDVTAQAVPSVPLAGTSDDNLRGDAVAVLDFDGDGMIDLVVSSDDAIADDTGGAARSTRLLRGTGTLEFEDASAYLAPPTEDTGEADDVLVGDLGGTGTLSLLLLTDDLPAQSTGGERFRVFDW